MSWVHSRRDFLKFAPGTLTLFFIAPAIAAQNPPQGSSTTNTNPNRPPNPGAGSGGGGFGGGGLPPGPAGHEGDFKPGRVTGMRDKDHTEPPAKPRKDLAEDQKSMRNEVQQLVRDTQDLKKALEQIGPKQALPGELIGKTKEIEKLARDIAALAKG